MSQYNKFSTLAMIAGLVFSCDTRIVSEPPKNRSVSATPTLINTMPHNLAENFDPSFTLLSFDNGIPVASIERIEFEFDSEKVLTLNAADLESNSRSSKCSIEGTPEEVGFFVLCAEDALQQKYPAIIRIYAKRQYEFTNWEDRQWRQNGKVYSWIHLRL
jgi:hypothetical protein